MATDETPKKYLDIRRFPRREFHARVGVLDAGQYEIENINVIGEGGLGVMSLTLRPLESQIVVSFFISQKGFITVTAQVVNSRPVENQTAKYALGIKFLNLSFQDKKLIRQYIATQTEET